MAFVLEHFELFPWLTNKTASLVSCCELVPESYFNETMAGTPECSSEGP